MIREFLWAWVPWAYNRSTDIYQKTHRLIKVIYNEFAIQKQWIFFKNVPVPVNSENFWNIEYSNIRWRCNVFPARFIDPNAEPDVKAKHLSYLGFVIKIDEKEIDLSNWINDVMYTGPDEPSVGEIFALWCCETGESYFHCLDSIQVEYITELGDVVRKRA